MRSLMLAAATFALPLASTAQGGQTPEGWQLTVGAGTLFSPAYEGDDDYVLSVLPNLKLEYQDKFFASVQDGFGYNLINTETVRAGPIGRFRFSRDEEGGQPFAVAGDETTDLIGLGAVDTTFEVGGFLAYTLNSLELGAELRQGVNGHNGLVFDATANLSGRYQPAGPPIFWSVGPRLRLVDESYNATYFSIDADQSLASGLPQFSASGGVYSYGVGASAVLPFGRRGSGWALVGIVGYDRLAGDAADAPLVIQRGSPNQATVGLFLSKTF